MKNFFLQHRATISCLSLSLIVLLLLIGYGLLPLPQWARHIVPGKTVSVTTVPVRTISKPVQVHRTGSIESPKSAPIHSEFSGVISEVYITEGQPVKTDQPLFKIISNSTSSRSSEPIYAATETSNAEINPQAQANYDKALNEYNRFQKLYQQGGIAKRQVDAAAARLQAAKELLDHSAQAASPAMQPLETATPLPSNSITMNAPNSGIVTALSAAVGKVITPGQPLMVLNVGEVQAVIHIKQKDLYLLHPGTPAFIQVSGQSIPGQVAAIYPEVDANNLPSFRAHITIPSNIDGLLKVGMSADVLINTGTSAAVHAVPSSAVLQDTQGLHYLYLEDNGKALRQQVTVGDLIGDFIEITSPLPEQASVITTNVNNITDGDTIILSQ